MLLHSDPAARWPTTSDLGISAMRFVAMIFILLGAFFLTSRLQVNEAARFVTTSGEVIEGRVSRDFVTGQYKIEQSDRSIRRMRHEELGAMSFEGSTIPWYASTLGFLLVIVAGCIGRGVDKVFPQVWKTARPRMRPGITHDRLPPSQRES